MSRKNGVTNRRVVVKEFKAAHGAGEPGQFEFTGRIRYVISAWNNEQIAYNDFWIQVKTNP